jgi:hypothetical protein
VKNDPLKPVNTQYNSARTQSIITWKNDRHDRKTNGIDPRCINNQNQHYIAATGHYMPCCYVGDWRFYYSSEFYKNQTEFDISTTTISDILNTTTFYSTLLEKKHKYCTFNCPSL